MVRSTAARSTPARPPATGQSPSQGDASTEVVEIDSDGDVILEFTSSQNPSGKTHLLVSSKVLSLASPVLKKLFEWEYRGRRSNARAPPKHVIPLPDDDLDAFTLICKITHFKQDGVPSYVNPDLLVNIAVACHKYDCVPAISYVREQWFRTHAKSENDKDLNKRLFVAYILDMPKAFSRTSWKILMSHTGQFTSLPGCTDQDMIPAGLILAEFSARHTELLLGVLDLVQKPINKQLGGRCDDSAQAIAHYIRLLASEELWPPSSLLENKFSINALLDKVKWEGPRWSCEDLGCTHCAHRNGYKFEGDLRRLKERFEGLRKGICLDCVRTDRNSLGEGECRYCSREVL